MRPRPPSRRISRRLQTLLQPPSRRVLAVQVLALALILMALGWAAVLVLVKLVQGLGPWWQQSR